jgi:hypothetical protein
MRTAATNAWQQLPLHRLASRQTPPDILGQYAWLLEADVAMTWMGWFIDGLVDRKRYIATQDLGYAHLYAKVQEELRERDSILPIDELRKAAAALSEFAWEDILRRRNASRRAIPESARRELWFTAEPSPRCYLCGYLFTIQARDRYLDRGKARGLTKADLPLLVDFTRPRGLVPRDMAVEVDHTAAVAAGGGNQLENLRLACGWCNRTKGARDRLYDAPATCAGTITLRALGAVSIPQPLWVLRVVATRSRCEHSSGCSAKLESHELFLAPRNLRGELNPINCAVYCAEHDPWVTDRYVGHSSVPRRGWRGA